MRILDWLPKSEPEFEFGLVENPMQDLDPRNVLYSEIALGAKAFEEEYKPRSLSLIRPPTVLNQGKSDTCVAFTGAHALGQINNKVYSPRFAWKTIKEDPAYASSQLSWGAYLADVAKFMQKHGMVTLDLLPNEPVDNQEAYRNFIKTPAMERAAEDNRIGGYAFVAQGNDDLAKFDAIVDYLARERRSMLGSVSWRTSFNKARKGGIVPAEAPTGKQVGHAMAIDGYTKINNHEYMEYCNSWGKEWGKGGKIFLPKGFYRITGGIGLMPLVVQAPKKPQVRNIAREQANAFDMRNWLYARFPERKDPVSGKVLFQTDADYRNAKIRGLAGTHWPVLVNAVSYLGYSHGDVYAWLEATVDGNKSARAFSFDFTKTR
jgi:hypothetical protein